MTDSYTTKAALVDAFKALMQEKPFAKIGIADICGLCGLHRKSFYYHFQDKFDLVSWMFDHETETSLHSASPILSLCSYLYDNRALYRKLLLIEGQNSFSDHFRAFLRRYLSQAFPQGTTPFVLDFYTDAYACAMERWLFEKRPRAPILFLSDLNSVSPKQFLPHLS